MKEKKLIVLTNEVVKSERSVPPQKPSNDKSPSSPRKRVKVITNESIKIEENAAGAPKSPA